MSELEHFKQQAAHAKNMEAHWRKKKHEYQAQYRKLWAKRELAKEQ